MAAPLYGNQLLPVAIEQIALSDPTRTFASMPAADGADVSQGYQDIDFASFSRAINRFAWWIETKCGRGANFPTLAYLGIQDVRYHIVQMAAIKCGYKVLIPSAVNSVSGMHRLLDETDCHIFLHASQVDTREMLTGRDLWIFEVPELEDMLASGDVKQYPYRKSFNEARDDPVAIFHTSGSTGFVKPITYTHMHYASVDVHNMLDAFDGRRVKTMVTDTARRALLIIDLYHIGCNLFALTGPVFGNVTSVYHPRLLKAKDVSVQLFIEMLEKGNVQSACVNLVVLKNLSKDPALAEKLGQLQTLFYGGVPLPPETGAILSKYVKLHSIMGSTETAFMPQWEVDAEDWDYICTKPQYFRKFSSDPELYELTYFRDENDPAIQAVFYTFPGIEEYATGDLWTKHPTKPNLWRSYGRKDNVIRLLTGANVNPKPIEEYMSSRSGIDGALVIGEGEERLSLVLELEDQSRDSESAVEAHWQEVENINAKMRKVERIEKRNIIIVTPDKRLPRSAKGEIQRKLAADMYKEEMKARRTHDS